MKRLALSTLTLALVAASGAAFAEHRDDRYHDGYSYDDRYQGPYGNDPRYRDDGPRYDTARVIDVDPIFASTRDHRRRECWWEPAVHRYSDNRYRNYDYYDRRYYSSYDNRRYRSSHDDGTEGAILGAIVGGALGNQAGKGDGKTAATVAGAVIGAAIGSSIDRNDGHDRRYQNFGSYNGAYDGYRYDDRYGYGYYGQNTRNGMVQRCGWLGDDRYGRDDRYDRYDRDGRHDERVIGYRVTYRYGGQTYHTTTPFHPGSTIRVRVDVDPVVGQHYAFNR
jgi:uncharacterized protein YcfJ